MVWIKGPYQRHHCIILVAIRFSAFRMTWWGIFYPNEAYVKDGNESLLRISRTTVVNLIIEARKKRNNDNEYMAPEKK
jgi:hypothetical protein